MTYQIQPGSSLVEKRDWIETAWWIQLAMPARLSSRLEEHYYSPFPTWPKCSSSGESV